MLGDVARSGVVAVPALERCDRRLQAGGSQELERREHASIDLPRADVGTPAGVEVDARVRQDASCNRLLRHQQDLPDARPFRAGAEEWIPAGCPVDGSRLEQLPSVEDRLRVDSGGAAPGRPDREIEMRSELRAWSAAQLANVAEHGPRDHLRTLLQSL